MQRILCRSFSVSVIFRQESVASAPLSFPSPKIQTAGIGRTELLDLAEFIPERIRNFSIIAHVDHGKSTLADRLLELTGTIKTSSSNAQVLDRLQVERERGITVKAQTASMFFSHQGTQYLLNLIDTPGHVDFNYEVSRALKASDGAILLVDANEGVQAQTVANFWLAFEEELVLLPILNKCDLGNAKPEKVALQMKSLFDLEAADCLRISAKLGTGVAEILPKLIGRLPAPNSNPAAPLKAFIFDSWYVPFRGAIAAVLVKDGSVERGQNVISLASGREYEIQEVGIMHPDLLPAKKLHAGQVGYIIAGMKTVQEARVGDTLCLKNHRVQPMPGFRAVKPMVFSGLFPVALEDYESLRSAIEK